MREPEIDRDKTADLAKMAKMAMDIAVEAGRAISDRCTAAGPTPAVTGSVRSKSSRTDLVTEADQASEQLIVSRLRAERPHDGILAEEGGSIEGTSGLTWVVDPLDGTINFVYGFPVFGVSIACVSRTATLVGVVHDPTRGETFTAVRGGGAFRDGARLRLDPGPPLSEALIGTGFSYESARRRSEGRLVARVLPQVRDIRRAGAAAIDLCWVAAGRLDGFYEAGLAPWDLAAGALLVTEAGGTVEDVPGLLADYPSVPTLVAGAPGLGDQLRGLLQSASAR